MKAKHRLAIPPYTWGETENPRHRLDLTESNILTYDLMLDRDSGAWISEYYKRADRIRGAA